MLNLGKLAFLYMHLFPNHSRPFSQIQTEFQENDQYAVIKMPNGNGMKKLAKGGDYQDGDDYQYGDWWLRK